MPTKKEIFELSRWIQSLTWKGRLKGFSKKGEYIAIKYNNTPDDNDSGFYEINITYYGEGTPEEWLVWKDKLLKALDGQGISKVSLWYIFTDMLLTGDAKATFNQAALDIGIRIVDNFNKVLAEITKHALPAYVGI